MGNTFSGYEIVELGVQIEKNGRDFYNEIVSKSRDQKAKETFEHLAHEEEKHIKTFEDILNSVHKYQPREAYPEEYFAYMNSLAAEHIFTKENKGREIAKCIESDAEAVELGIKFEKDSIVFYEGVKKVVPENEHKVIDRLIDEEKGHLEQLTNLWYGISKRNSNH